MKYINEIKKQKENTMNIVLYSVILGVIINVISNALGLILDIKPWIYLVAGIGVSVLLIGLTLIYNILKLKEPSLISFFNHIFLLSLFCTHK